jgi:GGDEF domain-containing protein
MTEFDGKLASLVSAFDLTERKDAEELLSVTDPLTGLGNYRRMFEALDAEVKRTGRPFAILLLDLDRLKKINDRYGHLVGSQALCRLADGLRVFVEESIQPRGTVAMNLPSFCLR